MAKVPGIVTPDILPGEPGWKELQTAKDKEKNKQKKTTTSRKTPAKVGKITVGDSAFRFGRASQNFKGDKKYMIWRYKRKVGELLVEKPESESPKYSLKLTRLGGIGNYKHLIQDANFQLAWLTREQELLMTQTGCYICKKKLSKTAQPNLYHYNLFKKRTKILEEADKVPQEILDGKLTISEGWQKFNSIIEDGNRYYMSLKDTALLCISCAKKKGIRD